MRLNADFIPYTARSGEMQSNLKPPVQHKHGINFGFKSILRLWEVLKLILQLMYTVHCVLSSLGFAFGTICLVAYSQCSFNWIFL
uniref:Uncharacterized protein n=1 Tax=Anguilla anguilla TaxID=7936 RepID=A0A0E9WZ00_ANGAN